jgi:valyl-tRNA synthetase
VLSYVIEASLRLMHPFIPFLTEELWQQLPQTGETIVRAPYPNVAQHWVDPSAERNMNFVMQVIAAIRNIRNTFKIPNTAKIHVYIKAERTQTELLDRFRPYILNLASIETMDIQSAIARPEHAVTAILDGMEIYVPLEGLIDVDVERARLTRELQKIQQDLTRLEAKLAHRDFVEKAPEDVIEKEQMKYQGLRERSEKLTHALEFIQ